MTAPVWDLGREEDLEKVVDILVEEGPARGLVLSTTITSPSSPKTTVWCPRRSAPPPQSLTDKGVVSLEEEGIILLGAPLGTPEFVAREVARKVEKVKEVTKLLPLRDGKSLQNSTRKTLSLKNLHTKYVQKMPKIVQN